MKLILILVLISLTSFSFSQEQGHKQFYQAANEEYAFTIDNYGCTFYKFERSGNYLYYHGQEFLSATRALDHQSDSLGILFSNGQYAISYDYKYFRVLKLRHGKPKDRLTYVAKKLDNPSQIYEAINYQKWEDLYQETIEGISHDYPLFHEYYNEDEIAIWNRLSYKQVEPKDFNNRVKERIEALRDSLKSTNWKMLSLNNEVERNMDRLTIEELKHNFSSRILYGNYKEYTDEMLILLAEKRSDLFFDLAASFPENKEYIFDGVISVKNANKSLRQYKTDAPIKKEYLKYMRKQKLINGLLITAISVLQSGVIGGAIAGVAYWIKN